MFCKVIENRIQIEQNTYITYGLLVFIHGEWERMEDLTTNFSAIKNLAQLLNNSDLDGCHLEDVVEDFLAGL